MNNLTEHWIDYLNERYGFAVNAKNISKRELSQAFPELTKEEIDSPLEDEKFGLTFKVRPYSAECLKHMIDDGHEISIVTAHNNRTVGTKFDWLLSNFPFLSRNDIIITSKKQKIIGDALIDDAIHNLGGGNYFKILFDRPDNRDYDAKANGMVRVYTLKEAYEVIKEVLL